MRLERGLNECERWEIVGVVQAWFSSPPVLRDGRLTGVAAGGDAEDLVAYLHHGQANQGDIGHPDGHVDQVAGRAEVVKPVEVSGR